MQYDLEAGKLLLHCPALPQEGVNSAFTLSSCQVHTELLPNPVCHISGGKKANLIEGCSIFQGYRGLI